MRDAIDFKNGNVADIFRRMLIPTLLGTVALSAVTAIDGIFIGHGVGAQGVAAVNIVFPVYQVMSGIGLMVGAGCSVVASIHLSHGKLKVARLNVTQAVAATSLLTLLTITAVLARPEGTARLLGASVTLLPQVVDYLQCIMPGFLFQMWGMVGLFIIRLDGAPRYAMWCNIVPAALNAVLDWLFIFPLGMGVKGAAIATALSLGAGGLMAMGYLLFFGRTLRLVPLKLSPTSLRLSARNLGYQCRVGSSSLLGELTLAVLVFTGNLMFMKYLGDDGVGAFGIVCYYTPFFFMVGNAIAQSAQPIISYNYGISRHEPLVKARRLLISTAVGFGLVIALLFLFLPKALVGLFVDPGSRAGRIAVEGFPYFSTGVALFVLNVAVIGYYQSVERVRRAALYVSLRGFVLLVPVFVALPLLLGVAGLWLAMPVTETLTLLVILAQWKSGKARKDTIDRSCMG